MDNKQYAEDVKRLLPENIRDTFGRDLHELCPFVQKLITEATPGNLIYEKNNTELEKYYQSISAPNELGHSPRGYVTQEGKKNILQQMGYETRPFRYYRFFPFIGPRCAIRS